MIPGQKRAHANRRGDFQMGINGACRMNTLAGLINEGCNWDSVGRPNDPYWELQADSTTAAKWNNNQLVRRQIKKIEPIKEKDFSGGQPPLK